MRVYESFFYFLSVCTENTASAAPAPRANHDMGSHCPHKTGRDRCKAALRESERHGWLYTPSSQTRCHDGGMPAIASRDANASTNALLRAYAWDSSTLDQPVASYNIQRLRSLQRLCRPPRPDLNDHVTVLLPESGSGRCVDGAAGLRRSTRLVVGVQSTVGSLARRDAIRGTWRRWADAEATLVCFVVGGVGLTTAQRGALATENAPLGDVLAMRGAGDGRCFLNMAKMWAWWRDAAHSFLQPGSRVTHVARTDDDAFVSLPGLLGLVRQLHCLPHMFFGSLAYSGYNAPRFTKCGFSWSPGRSTYRRTPFFKYGCATAGAHPPVPFAMGWIQLMTASLARHVGTSASIAAFVERCMSTPPDPTKWGNDRHEDVALGYFLAKDFGSARITYVDATPRLKNLGCFKNKGDYVNPHRGMLAVHYVKVPTGQHYLWDVLGPKARPHDSYNCSLYAGVA